jgi:hypothetical protein
MSLPALTPRSITILIFAMLLRAVGAVSPHDTTLSFRRCRIRHHGAQKYLFSVTVSVCPYAIMSVKVRE